MREVELWEAVALTINLEPDELPVYLGAYDAHGDNPFRICPSEFQERLQIANSNCGTTFPCKPVHRLRARSLVDLPTFGAWAAGVWNNLPREFPIAAPEGKPEPPAGRPVPVAINAAVNESILNRKQRRPAKLYGEGFSEEAQQITTLTKYLELETWKPITAALLVSGIQAPPDCAEFPKGAFSLDKRFLRDSDDPFHEARRVLELWNSQEHAPAKVRPAEFVAWCKTKNINTDWLSVVEVESRKNEWKQLLERPANNVTLPNGEFIIIWEFAKAVAEAIVPTPTREIWLSTLIDKRTKTGPHAYLHEDFLDADYDYLRGIWRGLPPFHNHLSELEFEPYMDAFRAAPDRPGWEPYVRFVSGIQEAKIERQTAKMRHLERLEKEIESGQLSALDSYRAATISWKQSRLIARSDALAYLARCGLKAAPLETAEPQAAPVMATSAQPAHAPQAMQANDELATQVREIKLETKVSSTGKQTETTLKYHKEVMRLMDYFWNNRAPGSLPTKTDLQALVYTEMERGHVRGRGGKHTQPMVKDAAKKWVMPRVLPNYVPHGKTTERRHAFKGDR